MEPLISLEPSTFQIVLIWQIAFIGFALAQLNKQRWVERAGLIPLITALWMTFS
tara:strand:- start:118 stop:279 length:162 start_codon:yes stop_codon:yes gene_type:complete